MYEASFIGLSRHRIGTDGHGVTTLVAFHGCTLKCKFCLNPQCHSATSGEIMTTEEVMEVLKKDELYFIATNGGVTFGGGEPLLNSKFIKELMLLGANQWHTTIETSLSVPNRHLKTVYPFIDEYIVDVKDMNPQIYNKYTGTQRLKTVINNLQWLIDHGKADKITIRLPLIPGYNSEGDRQYSKILLSKMGLTHFDMLTYKKNF